MFTNKCDKRHRNLNRKDITNINSKRWNQKEKNGAIKT